MDYAYRVRTARQGFKRGDLITDPSPFPDAFIKRHCVRVPAVDASATVDRPAPAWQVNDKTAEASK
jgi:hypothetical protein